MELQNGGCHDAWWKGAWSILRAVDPGSRPWVVMFLYRCGRRLQAYWAKQNIRSTMATSSRTPRYFPS